VAALIGAAVAVAALAGRGDPSPARPPVHRVSGPAQRVPDLPVDARRVLAAPVR
jgi:hypothetical protein